MISVKGYAAASATSAIEPFQFERRELRANDVLIDIKFCGICHSDIHQARDEWGGSIFPMVPGHEIVGVVARTGDAVTKFRVGDVAGVGCFVDSCRHCAYCHQGLEQYCAEIATQTYNALERDGKTPTRGGYSDRIVVNENYVYRMPDTLPLDASAPLLCAGITLYSPLKHWGAGPGKRVAIVGLGGLGHMGVKIAHALGAEVTVLSQSPRKRAEALRMGADHFYDTSAAPTFSSLQNHFDLIINTVSAGIDWNQYLGLVKVDGSMVVVGAPEHPVPVHAFSLIPRRRTLAGSMIGGVAETQEMLDFCAQHHIVSDIEVIPVQRINEAYERVLRSDVRYRFVIDMSTLSAQ